MMTMGLGRGEMLGNRTGIYLAPWHTTPTKLAARQRERENWGIKEF